MEVWFPLIPKSVSAVLVSSSRLSIMREGVAIDPYPGIGRAG